jgi:hypothetical protein
MKDNSENMEDMIFLKSFSENLGGVRDIEAKVSDPCPLISYAACVTSSLSMTPIPIKRLSFKGQ